MEYLWNNIIPVLFCVVFALAIIAIVFNVIVSIAEYRQIMIERAEKEDGGNRDEDNA